MTEDGHVASFRAADAYAVEVVRAAQRIGTGRDATLLRELRRSALRCGGALVAASVAHPTSVTAKASLEAARGALAEGGYYLYLARRFGLLDARGYRALRVRQEAALKELTGLLDRSSSSVEAPEP
ncbi:MAG: four helix bundle protein [Acidobacteriota bacterium]|nr:four helix bundle protein [Acidobacteriota bacterium]MDH3785421.1 four helix bundle protein [Acidobacteriota bacterium]